MRWMALVCVLVVGCSQEPPPRRFDAASSHEPASHSFHFPQGTLTVLEVPLQSGRVVEMQRCFLWRSQTTESLHCAGETDAAPPMRLPDDPPGPAERY